MPPFKSPIQQQADIRIRVHLFVSAVSPVTLCYSVIHVINSFYVRPPPPHRRKERTLRTARETSYATTTRLALGARLKPWSEPIHNNTIQSSHCFHAKERWHHRSKLNSKGNRQSNLCTWRNRTSEVCVGRFRASTHDVDTTVGAPSSAFPTTCGPLRGYCSTTDFRGTTFCGRGANWHLIEVEVVACGFCNSFSANPLAPETVKP